MHVVVGYTNLRPEVQEALDRHAAAVEVVYQDCAHSNETYHDLLDEHWQAGTDFAVVEHDIVIDERVVPTFERCPEPWCGFGYELAVGYRVALGCTRFRAALMDAVPDLFELTQTETQSGVPRKAWYRLDARVDQILREHGYTPHLHMPPVKHLNAVQRLAEPVPVYAAGEDR